MYHFFVTFYNSIDLFLNNQQDKILISLNTQLAYIKPQLYLKILKKVRNILINNYILEN